MIKIGFFDNINNSLIVNTVKKLLQREDAKYFHVYRTNSYSVVKYALLK